MYLFTLYNKQCVKLTTNLSVIHKNIINVDISQTSQVLRLKSFNIAEMIKMGDKTSHHKKNKNVYLYVCAFSKKLKQL